jgi:PIN domain nuclease of toxin-antitoxin system
VGRDEVIVLDTHAAIWFTTEDSNLGRRARAMARSSLGAGTLFVSAITFWEIAMLVSKHRVRTFRSAAEQRMIVLDAGVQELPISGEIAIRAVELDNLPSDPADRLIMATAITHGATLMTADEALLNWRHPVRRADASK